MDHKGHRVVLAQQVHLDFKDQVDFKEIQVHQGCKERKVHLVDQDSKVQVVQQDHQVHKDRKVCKVRLDYLVL
jgi:hypothetical protein